MFCFPACLHRWYARPLVVLMLLASPALPTVFAVEWVEVVRTLESAVPRLAITYPGGEQGSCSAVIINAKKGYALTAGHCTKIPNATFAFADQRVLVVKTDAKLDLSLLSFAPKHGWTQLKLAKATPPAGAPALLAGYAFGAEQLYVQAGIVANPLEKYDGQLILNIEVIAGDSGGPVVNAAGELIGVTVQAWFAPPAQLTCAIPVEGVRGFVAEYLP